MSEIDRKTLAFKMRELGIRKPSQVWDAVNNGGTQEEIDALLVTILEEQAAKDNIPVITLRDEPIAYPIFGRDIIEPVAIEDMNAVARLPYVKQVALMPDAHRVKPGHVPVGGVVVTEDCILPGVVGSDIACSVRLTVTDTAIYDNWFVENRDQLVSLLENKTWFGIAINDIPRNDLQEWGYFKYLLNDDSLAILRGGLRHTESHRLLDQMLNLIPYHFGTSGDGNHFIELGTANDSLAILSHFGSRGVGAEIAKFYLNKANELHRMPNGLKDNAPLFVGTDGWAEDYLNMMQFAGEFARESHRYIHNRLLDAIADSGLLVPLTVASVYIQHNFAWDEGGVYVHRKGATPAHVGTVGIIPATMGDTSLIVRGLGNPDFINSSSHGAGRRMSRSVALRSLTNTREYVLKEYGVVLSGGGEDEDPRAYKRIDDVMQFQTDSVKVVGTFTPRIVRMSPPRRWGKKS